MAIKVIIRQFEIIEDAKLVLDGLVALVGESNNGKTATYNALKVLTYNIQGTGYIRKINGKPYPAGCSVGIRFDDTNSEVTFEKSTSPVYTLKVGDSKQVFDKAGRGPTPEDVSLLLNMVPLDIDGLSVNLNFADQLEEPLLRKLTDFQLYKLAVKSSDGEKIQEAIALCRKDTDEKAKELVRKEEEIVVQKKSKLSLIADLDRYSNLIDIKVDYEVYDKICRVLPYVITMEGQYSGIVNSISTVDANLSLFEKHGVIFRNYDVAKKLIATLNYVVSVSDDYEKIVTNINVTEKKLDSLNKLNDLEKEKISYTLGVGKLRLALEYNNSLLNIEAESNIVSTGLTTLGNNLSTLTNDLMSYKDSVKKLSDTVSFKEEYESISNRINSVTSQLETYTDISGFDKYKKTCTSLNILPVLGNQQQMVSKRLCGIEEELKLIETDRASTQYMIDNHVCPVCGMDETGKKCNH
jgi:hypothetical protein